MLAVDNVDMDLTDVLQQLYDSGINVTVTTLWDGGYDFGLCSPMQWPEAFPNQFHSVKTAADLAAAIHKAALDECPESDYAKNYRDSPCSRLGV